MSSQAPFGDLSRDTALFRLLQAAAGDERAQFVFETLEIAPELLEVRGSDQKLDRSQIAMALNAVLFSDLLDRVPTAARYVEEQRAKGEAIVLDHGALRTVDSHSGELVPGYKGFFRFLEPLGYEVGGLYPLPALRMTGRALVHRDMPDAIPQFFVSELHLGELPVAAQDAAARVFGTSRDPIGENAWTALEALACDGHIDFDSAVTILRDLVRAFGRQHDTPTLTDYETLLEHSREGAWIATEGNDFNHATTRVPDVVGLSEELRAAGYPMKEAVETSRNGRVRQTAFLADKVRREFRTADGTVTREVPGSFYEFITRDIDPASGSLDLTFDSGNATGIFAVTRERA
jgi:PAS domain-containing protein